MFVGAPGMGGYGATLDRMLFEDQRKQNKQNIQRTMEEVLTARQSREHEANMNPLRVDELSLKNLGSRLKLNEDRATSDARITGTRAEQDRKVSEARSADVQAYVDKATAGSKIDTAKAETKTAQANSRLAAANAVAKQFDNKVRQIINVDEFAKAWTVEQNIKAVQMIQQRMGVAKQVGAFAASLPDTPANRERILALLKEAGAVNMAGALEGKSVPEMARFLGDFTEAMGKSEFMASAEPFRIDAVADSTEEGRVNEFNRKLRELGITHDYSKRLFNHKHALEKVLEQWKAGMQAGGKGSESSIKNFEHQLVSLFNDIKNNSAKFGPDHPNTKYAQKLYDAALEKAREFGYAKAGLVMGDDGRVRFPDGTVAGELPE